jgi:hypothetical protein
LARDNAGNSIAARIAMMAMTTSNSISVNPARFAFEVGTVRQGNFDLLARIFSLGKVSDCLARSRATRLVVW